MDFVTLFRDQVISTAHQGQVLRTTSGEGLTTRLSPHGEAEPEVPRQLLSSVIHANHPLKGRVTPRVHHISSRKIMPEAVKGGKYGVQSIPEDSRGSTAFDSVVQAN
jgi:hypothetical protein